MFASRLSEGWCRANGRFHLRPEPWAWHSAHPKTNVIRLKGLNHVWLSLILVRLRRMQSVSISSFLIAFCDFQQRSEVCVASLCSEEAAHNSRVFEAKAMTATNVHSAWQLAPGSFLPKWLWTNASGNRISDQFSRICNFLICPYYSRYSFSYLSLYLSLFVLRVLGAKISRIDSWTSLALLLWAPQHLLVPKPTKPATKTCVFPRVRKGTSQLCFCDSWTPWYLKCFKRHFQKAKRFKQFMSCVYYARMTKHWKGFSGGSCPNQQWWK